MIYYGLRKNIRIMRNYLIIHLLMRGWESRRGPYKIRRSIMGWLMVASGLLRVVRLWVWLLVVSCWQVKMFLTPSFWKIWAILSPFFKLIKTTSIFNWILLTCFFYFNISYNFSGLNIISAPSVSSMHRPPLGS